MLSGLVYLNCRHETVCNKELRLFRRGKGAFYHRHMREVFWVGEGNGTSWTAASAGLAFYADAVELRHAFFDGDAAHRADVVACPATCAALIVARRFGFEESCRDVVRLERGVVFLWMCFAWHIERLHVVAVGQDSPGSLFGKAVEGVKVGLVGTVGAEGVAEGVARHHCCCRYWPQASVAHQSHQLGQRVVVGAVAEGDKGDGPVSRLTGECSAYKVERFVWYASGIDGRGPDDDVVRGKCWQCLALARQGVGMVFRRGAELPAKCLGQMPRHR